MSDDDDALRLNTLHRFRKHSPRLLLEEYSHCEVPAGCGGVVLRWVDPGVIPAIVRWHVPAEVEWWLDGVTPASGRVDLRPGPHVLALALTRIERPSPGRLAGLLSRERPAALLLSIVRALDRDREDGDGVVPLLRSGMGRTWRVSADPPPDGWTAWDFDDSSWRTPARARLDDERPPPPDQPQQRVLRGGSWADTAATVTVSFRCGRADAFTPNIGFRLVRHALVSKDPRGRPALSRSGTGGASPRDGFGVAESVASGKAVCWHMPA